MKKLLIIGSILFSIIFNATNTPLHGQTTGSGILNINDSLSLKDIIQQVIKTYPTIKDAEEGLKAADAKICLANAAYYPDLSIEGNYTRIGPVPQFSFPGFGDIQLAPYNNYSANVVLRQRIYDFGKTSDEVAFEHENKNLLTMSLEQSKQKLSLAAVGNYYALIYLQEAIRIKDEQLQTLNEHLHFVQKKEATGSATQYEILATKVKISGIESQKLDIEAAYKSQLSVLNSLLDEPENTVHYLAQENFSKNYNYSCDNIFLTALTNRDEIKIAKEKEKLAELHLDVINNQNVPTLDMFSTAGMKNGYEPNIFKNTYNFAVGVTVRIPLFDGTKNKNNVLLAGSVVKSSAFQTQTTEKAITNELVEAEANYSVANRKVAQFQIQLTQAEKAFALAEVSFKAGTITNLDLLDAATSLSEAKLYLLKANIDSSINMYKLKAAIGERLYTE